VSTQEAEAAACGSAVWRAARIVSVDRRWIMQRRQLMIVPWAQLFRVGLGSLDLDEVSDLVWRATNDERNRYGLRSLERHARLDRVAAAHSQDMAVRGYFDHRDPEGNHAADRVALRCRGLVVRGIGENIARLAVAGAGASLAAQMIRMWMGSPGHRANILDSAWTHLGVGLWRRGGYVWATQLFACLAAELEGAIPGTLRQGAIMPLRFRVYPPWNRPREVEAIVRVPDPRLRIAHGHGYYGIGWYPAHCAWQGAAVWVHFAPRHGPGQYEIGLVKRHTGEYIPLLRVAVI